MSRIATERDRCALFFKQLSKASQRILLIDYDGTVAPFSVDRHRALPYPSVPGILRRIMNSCGTRLIIISGRSAREVPPLLGITPVPEVWGTYGIERLHTDGRYEEVSVSDEALGILAHAEAQLEDEGLDERVEVKLAGVAVHWRGLPASEILKIRTKAYKVLEPLAFHPDLLLAEFEAGVEIRLRSANKGNAVRNLLSELNADIPVAYLGDDSTDEDAFRVLNNRGLSVLVWPKQRFTAAQVRLRPPDELIQFFTEWIRACEGEQ